MAELTLDHSFLPVSQTHTYSIVDVAADAEEIYAAAYVQLTAGGYAVIVGDTGGLGVGPVIGVNERNVPDQTGASDGDAQSNVYQGLFKRPIASSNPVTDKDMFKTVYAANNFDVTNDSTQPALGIMVGIDNDAGKCTILVGVGNRVLSVLSTGVLPLPLTGFYLNTGVPLAAFADGVSPTPGLSLNDSEAAGIRWNDDATPAQIVASFPVPSDLDITKQSFVILTAAKVGATAGDVPKIGVELFEHPIGSAYDAGADLGGDTQSMGDEPTKEMQILAATIAADSFSDPGTSSNSATITLQPEAGKLGTDDLILTSARLVYSRV